MKQMMGAAAMLIASLTVPPNAQGERHTIDAQRSVITLRVYKSGLFSVFAHDHEIRATIARGKVEDSENPSVELWVEANQLRVVDSKLSADDRAEVQRTMEGPKVLDAGRFPEIHFRSTRVEKTGAGLWIVHGDLDLHGKTGPVVVEVRGGNGYYKGSATLQQRNFGISPVSLAGGTVKVKDAVRVEFEVFTTR